MSKSFRQFSHELVSIVKDKKVLISVSAVALVPLLYSFMFLWTFWDPYAKMDVLPVAVVNMDKGAAFEGKQLSVGDQFVEKLKTNPAFGWDFISQGEAEKGLKEHKYYMAIEIPEDFSQRATEVLGADPQPATFRYIPNESSNFLAAQIGKTAVERIKGELSAELTKTYTETLFASVGKLSEGLAQAADGASKLSAGTGSVVTGLEQLDEGLVKLTAGTQPLETGAVQLYTGATKLNDGLAQLQKGATAVSGGLEQLSNGHQAIVQGAAQSEEGAAKLNGGLAASSAGLDQLKTGADGLAAGLEQLAAAMPQLAENPSFAKLVEAGKQVAAGTDSAAAAQKQLAAGAAQLAEGQKTLHGGIVAFNAKLNEAAAGSKSVADGASQLVPGSAQLKAGLAQIENGIGQLANGTVQLSDGSKKLTDGAQTVAGGTGELSGKLKDASVQTSSINGNDKLYAAFSQPVAFEEQKMAEVPNYGTGFAPYFMSLGLFVGALLLTIVFPVKDPAVRPRSGASCYFGKLGTMLFIGLIQALVMAVVIKWGLGLTLQNMPLYFVLTVLTSWTFMIMIQMLVSMFANPGRFVAIVILILQLTTCAGTFPVELIPGPLQVINKWLPMAYSVQGYKAVISSGEMSDFNQAALLLGIFMVVMVAITLTYYIIHFRKQQSAPSTQMEDAVAL